MPILPKYSCSLLHLSPLISLFLGFTASVGLAQQPPAKPATDPPGAIALARQQMGQSGLLLPLHASGIMRKAGEAEGSTFDLYVLAPSIYRLELHDGSSYVSVAHEDEGYVFQAGKKQRLSYNEVFGKRCPYIPLYSRLGDDSSLPSIADFQTSQGSIGLRLRKVDADVPSIAEYFDDFLELDSTSHLPVRLQTRLLSRQSLQIGITAEYLYSDYSREGPYLLPHTVEMRTNGNSYAVFSFSKFEFNPRFTADLFEVR